MIILDTDVLSELMKPKPAAKVVDWTAAQPAASLHTTSITQAEILHGLMLLPPSRRRSALEAAATSMFGDDFAGRILGFGSDVAPTYAQIASDRDAPDGPSHISTPRLRQSHASWERPSPPATPMTSMAAA